jgi:hypothetical protein
VVSVSTSRRGQRVGEGRDASDRGLHAQLGVVEGEVGEARRATHLAQTQDLSGLQRDGVHVDVACEAEETGVVVGVVADEAAEDVGAIGVGEIVRGVVGIEHEVEVGRPYMSTR